MPTTEVNFTNTKEPTYFINESKLTSLKEIVNKHTRKYSLYSKYAEGKTEELLNEVLLDLREVRDFVTVDLMKEEGMN
jgi:hypothetical protein